MKKMLTEERTVCDFEGCEDIATSECSVCGHDFCSEHLLWARISHRGDSSCAYICFGDFDKVLSSPFMHLIGKADTFRKSGCDPERNKVILADILSMISAQKRMPMPDKKKK